MSETRWSLVVSGPTCAVQSGSSSMARCGDAEAVKSCSDLSPEGGLASSELTGLLRKGRGRHGADYNLEPGATFTDRWTGRDRCRGTEAAAVETSPSRLGNINDRVKLQSHSLR